jgi:TP901 family phage tail tape measure protein
VPATVRDILLMIRAKEDVQRSMGAVAGSMRRAAAAADAASARARAAALRGQAAQARLAGATQAQVGALTASARAWDQQATAIGKNATRMQQLGTQAQQAGHVMQTTGIVMMAAGAATVYGLKQAVDVATEWDKQVRMTYTQVDKRFKPSLEELGDIGLRVSRKVAVPFEKVQEALFDVFSSTEANLPQAEKLLEAFAKAAVAGQTDIQTASRATIGLMNSYKIPFEDVNKVLDIQFQLVQEGIGTYEEWATKIGNVTPSAARAGQSIETMAAALATATRQGMNAARSSTSVARAFDAMSNPKTEKNLKKIGVNSRDAKGNFRPLVDVMADWRRELEKMPKEDRVANIIETLKGAGGTIEARRFLQNILLTKGGLELFQDQIKEFSTDKGAFERAYNEMADSVTSKTQILKNSWKQLQLSIGQALLPAFSDLIDMGQKVLDWFNKLPKGVQGAIAQFLLWGSLVAIVAGGITVLVGVLVGFAGILAVAGTAIIPILAAMAGIAAVVGLVTAGIVALAAGFLLAYNESKPFRDLMNEIGGIFTFLRDEAVKFAEGVWSNFETYLMPAFRNLRGVIEKEILPKFTEFTKWFREELEPRIQTASAIIQQSLIPAFQTASDYINTSLIPALREMAFWWQQNEYWIKPLVSILLSGLVAGALLAYVAITRLATALGFLARLGTTGFRTSMLLVSVAIAMVRQRFQQLGAIIQGIINWFRNLGNGAATEARRVQNTFTNMINSIRNAFASAPTMLLNAGRQIVGGLVQGIQQRIGEAAATARNLAGAVISGAKGMLGISSPSKVFKDIGINVVRGFTNGVRDAKTVKQLHSAFYRLNDAVMKSIREADISVGARRKMATKWGKRLTSTIRTLTSLENKRITVQNRLAAAQKSVNDQIKERDELASKIAEAVRKSSDITSLDDREKRSTARMVTGLQKRLDAVKAFSNNLRTLARRGFDKETIAQLAQQGVETAGSMVNMLANGSQSDLNQISKIQAEIRKIAGSTGTTVAGDLYNAGIKAGQGLVKGLQSQLANITKQMNSIAAALVKAIKKELGIKSPSRVFQDIGVNTAQGYVNGYVARMNRGVRTMQRASMFDPSARMTLRNNQPAMGTQVIRNYDQKITVNTQEIDPRKNSAELGWMLEGRMP